MYPWSTRAAAMPASARERTARFVSAAGPEEIVFVSGTTAGLNAVAMSWGLANLRDGDEILFSPVGHASNVYPWVHLRQVLARFGANSALVPYTVTATGAADPADTLARMSPRTRLIVATHIHNLFGSMTTLAELSGKIDESVRVCFDCSQSVGHVPVDVTRVGADFAAFPVTRCSACRAPACCTPAAGSIVSWCRSCPAAAAASGWPAARCGN